MLKITLAFMPTTVNYKSNYFVFFLFFVIGLILFSQNLNNEFISDDFVILDKIAGGGVWVNSNSQFGANFFRPIASYSYKLDSLFYKQNSAGFHFSNILIHIFNSWLLFLIIKKLFSEFSFSILTGLLFLALHSHVEPVAWISCRSDLLAVFFSLLFLLIYIQYRETRNISLFLLALIFYFLSLISKESSVFIFFFVFFYDLLMGNKVTFKSHRLEIIGFIFIISAILIIRKFFLGSYIGGYNPEIQYQIEVIKLLRRILTFPLRSIFPYMENNHDPYSRRTQIMFTIAYIGIYLTFIFIIAILAWRIKFFNREKFIKDHIQKLLFYLLIFYINLIPVIAFDISIVDIQSERFMYLPSIFLVIFVSYFVFHFLNKYILYLYIAFSSALLMIDSSYYKDAAVISRNIIESVQKSSCTSLTLLNLPDNIRGAYIFRNGLRESLNFHKIPKSVDFIFMEVLGDAEGGVQLDRLDGDTFKIKPTHKLSTFILESKKDNPKISISQFGIQEFVFRRVENAECIVYYNNGNLHELK